MNGKNLDRCVGGLLVIVILQLLILFAVIIDRVNLVCTLN